MKATIPSDVWETKRSEIANLYKDEEWPLKQVMKRIRSEDFNPTETQLRSRLKKWGVTKPSRQRRKKPSTRQVEDNNNMQHLDPTGLRRRADESSLPQILASSLPHCGSPNIPEAWNNHNHRQWAFTSTQDRLLDGRQQAEGPFASPNASPPGYSSDGSTSHYTGPPSITVPQAVSDHTFGYPYPVSSPTHEIPVSGSCGGVDILQRIQPGFTQPGDIPISSKSMSNGLPMGWQSPDSTQFRARGGQNIVPAPPLPSPALHPRSPWKYPTPEACQNCSPTIYPMEDSTMKQLNYANDLIDSDDSRSYPSLDDIPLIDADIFESTSSIGSWKSPTHVPLGHKKSPQYTMAERTFCQGHRQDGKPQSDVSTLGLTDTQHSLKLDPPGQFGRSPIIDINLSPPSTVSSPHSTLNTDGVNAEYFLMGANLA